MEPRTALSRVKSITFSSPQPGLETYQNVVDGESQSYDIAYIALHPSQFT